MKNVGNRHPGEKQKISQSNLSIALESYLEHIHDLQIKYGAVRVSDLAKIVGCRMPTVTCTLRRLACLGLINYEKYRPVTLTPQGAKTVKKLDNRQRALSDFLENVLCLEAELVEDEACILEHQLSATLLTRVKQFVEFMRSSPNSLKLLETQKKQFTHFLSGNSDSITKRKSK